MVAHSEGKEGKSDLKLGIGDCKEYKKIGGEKAIIKMAEKVVSLVTDSGLSITWRSKVGMSDTTSQTPSYLVIHFFLFTTVRTTIWCPASPTGRHS